MANDIDMSGFPLRTIFWPSMRDRPFFNAIKEMMIQREPDAPEIGSFYISIPNPDYKATKYFKYENALAQWEGSYLPIKQRGKKPIEPQPPYKPMSDEDFKTLLIDYGVTKNPQTNYNFANAKTVSNNIGGANSNSLRNNSVSGSTLAAEAKQVSTNKDQLATPIIIYAKERYGIEYESFTNEKYLNKAKIDLGINDESKLIPKDKREKREKNFEAFKEKCFAKYNVEAAFELPNVPQYDGPQVGTDAYNAIKTYSLTDYGSIMVNRILASGQDFQVRIEDTLTANAGTGFLSLPTDFPLKRNYPVGGQKIIPSAVLHHEFEHTEYGTASNIKGSLVDERIAVIKFENPARIVHGHEPRYVYYQDETVSLNGMSKTINIITGKVYMGKWTFNKKDPRKMMKSISNDENYIK